MVSIMMRPNYTKTGLEAVIRTVEMRVMIRNSLHRSLYSMQIRIKENPRMAPPLRELKRPVCCKSSRVHSQYSIRK